ncbi:DUF6624 domain-containing protein [Lewinella sp. IMCC34191]|uniref:DUF6624 domain-containing protein n=1 Tax=Lewinella sp. IMCC34191 TaxID=2259172 RepID=UPI000E251DA1|nr:DUF6624 domain-containing protein [Lewinella sp. IMCC34191]
MRQLLIPLCLLTLPLCAQTLERADSLFGAGAYQTAAEAYTTAFATDTGDVYQLYSAASAWTLAGDTSQALFYLQQAADRGYRHADHVRRDENLTTLQHTGAWSPIVAAIEANLAEHEKDYDHELQDRLERIYLEDQVIRQLWEDAEKRFGKRSAEMEYFWETIQRQDSLNELAVIDIIEANGWPASSLVGEKANRTVWLVIQHADLALQEKYLPLLRASVSKGESNGSDLALLEDRILMYSNKPQLYGSQVRSNPETGALEVYEIADPENVNRRRAEVGLGSLEAYLARFGIEWSVQPQKQ